MKELLFRLLFPKYYREYCAMEDIFDEQYSFGKRAEVIAVHVEAIIKLNKTLNGRCSNLLDDLRHIEQFHKDSKIDGEFEAYKDFKTFTIPERWKEWRIKIRE